MRLCMRHLIGLIALGLLAGCSYTGLMKPWIGESADSLVARWGAPASTTTLPDGGSVIEYHDSVRPGVSGFPARGPYWIRVGRICGTGNGITSTGCVIPNCSR